MSEPIRITDQLEGLFPGKAVTIGSQTITIAPLGIGKLAQISRKLRELGRSLAEEGVTWDNYNETENTVKIAITLLERFPEVLQQATNIHKDDIEGLPLETVLELLNAVVDANIASKERLEKNFSSLVGKIGVADKKVKPKK